MDITSPAFSTWQKTMQCRGKLLSNKITEQQLFLRFDQEVTQSQNCETTEHSIARTNTTRHLHVY